MDLSPAWQAGPPLVAGLITLMVGLVLPGVLKKITVVAGGLLALAALSFGALYVGLVYAFEAWDKYPEPTWIGLVSLLLLTAATVSAKSTRKHKRDEDEEDDGGLGVYSPKEPPPAAPAPSPAPAPTGPSLDWADFDSTRESWERTQERTPVGV